jgi:DegV family protein with EDD domain
MFAEVYDRLLKQGYERICSIHCSNKLSGIYNAARVAAEGSKERVTVIDSGSLSMGLGFQAISAARAALEGSWEMAMEAIASIRQRAKLVAMLDTLEQLKRSGRVSWARASLGSLLKIKLFLEVVDGDVLRLGEARTRRKGIARLTGILAGIGPLEHLAVLHTNAREEAEAIAQQFAGQVVNAPLIQNVTTVIGTHVGVNGLGFVAVRRQ